MASISDMRKPFDISVSETATVLSASHSKPSQAISITQVFMSCLYAAASALVAGLDGW